MAIAQTLLPSHTKDFNFKSLIEHMRLTKDVFRRKVVLLTSGGSVSGEIIDFIDGHVVLRSADSRSDVNSGKTISSYSVIPLPSIVCLEFEILE